MYLERALYVPKYFDPVSLSPLSSHSHVTDEEEDESGVLKKTAFLTLTRERNSFGFTISGESVGVYRHCRGNEKH